MSNAFERAMGIGDVEIVGRPASSGASGANAQGYQDREYKNAYEVQVGFDGGVVAAGASVDVNVTVVRPFLPRQMTIPSDICFDFTLSRMLLADRDFVEGAVPCAQYGEHVPQPQSDRPRLEIGTIDTKDTLRMRFTNTGPAPLHLRGSFLGTRITT